MNTKINKGENNIDISNSNSNSNNEFLQNNNNIEYLFMNPSLFQKIQKQNTIQETLYDKKEYRFYKKRILQLFKDIMNKKIENDEMKDVYNIFVLKSIDYLKNIDKTEILQKDYKIKNVHFNLEEQEEVQGENIEQNIEQEETQKETTNMEINKILYKNNDETKHFRIDKLLNIERKRTRPKQEIILPKQKEVNLQDPKLKTKGIKKKQKNKNIDSKTEENREKDKKQ
jgi:hypothetical protein